MGNRRARDRERKERRSRAGEGSRRRTTSTPRTRTRRARTRSTPWTPSRATGCAKRRPNRKPETPLVRSTRAPRRHVRRRGRLTWMSRGATPMTGRSWTTARDARFTRCRASCRGGSGCRRALRARRFDRDGASGRAGRRVGAQGCRTMTLALTWSVGCARTRRSSRSAFASLTLVPTEASAAWRPAISARMTSSCASLARACSPRRTRARAPPWAGRASSWMNFAPSRSSSSSSAPRARRADGRRGSPPSPAAMILDRRIRSSGTVSVVARRSRRGAPPSDASNPPRFGAREIAKPSPTRWVAPRSATSRHPP